MIRNPVANFRVLVTPTTFGKSDPALRQTLQQAVGEVIYNDRGRPLRADELCHLLPGCDGYIAGLDVIDRQAIEAADCLKVIARYGVGVDKVDLAAAAERGIVVTNTPNANSVSVAELTVGLMLALARSLPRLHSEVRTGSWPRLNGVVLEGKTVGLVGLGAIGRQVAARLNGWGVRVLASDPVLDAATAHQYGAELVTLDQLVREADYVSLHVPVLANTRGMVNAEFLARMKPGAHLVNTARGELVDEAALAAALASGHLRGAALDAFAAEPPDPASRLLNAPNVIVTPHCGAHTDGAAAKMGWTALNDCLAVLHGETPAYRVVPKGYPSHA